MQALPPYCQAGDQSFCAWVCGGTPYHTIAHAEDTLISEGPKAFRCHVPGGEDGDQICIPFVNSTPAAVGLCVLHTAGPMNTAALLI